MRSDRMAVNFEWGAHDGSQLSRSLVEGQLRQRYELLQDFQARCAATSGKRRNPVAQLVQHHARHCQLRWSQRLQPRHDARVPAESVADGVGAVRQHQPGGCGLPGGQRGVGITSAQREVRGCPRELEAPGQPDVARMLPDQSRDPTAVEQA